MFFNCKQTDSGIRISIKNKNFYLRYPNKVWKSFPSRDFLFDNLTYLSTISMPLIARINNIEYNTSKPYFQKEFQKGIIREIPSSADDYNLSTKKVINKLNH